MSKRFFVRSCSIILLPFLFFQLAWKILPGVFEVWDYEAGDQLTRLAYHWQGNREISPDIVHIDLGDQDLKTIPYSENDPELYAELINILANAGVKTILIDILFPKCRADHCRNLVEEVASAGSVYFPVILSGTNDQNKTSRLTTALPDSTYWKIDINTISNDIADGQVALTNFTALNEGAGGLGHINSQPDADGVFRRIPLLINTEKGIIPALALRAACSYLDIQTEHLEFTSKGKLSLRDVTLPDGRTLNLHIPVGDKARNRINFSGPLVKTFSHYSFSTILKQGTSPEGLMLLTDELEDTLAIVSDISTSGKDFGPVPFSSYFPLSGLHSNFINSILNNDFLTEINYTQNLLLNILLIILLYTATIFYRGYRFISISAILYFGFIGTCLYLFFEYRILVPIVKSSLSFIMAVIFIMFFQYLDVQKEKQYIWSTLANYFSPSLMTKILQDPGLIKGVSRKNLTVLFSDIVGFSTWSSTQDAGFIHQTLNDYFDEMATIIFKYEGTIDKYMGDGLMVFFGDPISQPDHATRAVKTAREMQKKTRELKEKWEKTGGMDIEIRIGIHSGEMVVGNMGSQSRMEYTVIGSDVNLAQRLESNCPPGEILISKEVKNQLEGLISTTSMGDIQAKGFHQQISVFTVDNEQTKPN